MMGAFRNLSLRYRSKRGVPRPGAAVSVKRRSGDEEVQRVTIRARPPQRVLIERDLVQLTPRDLTAEIFGDPPRGRSALDRKGQAQ